VAKISRIELLHLKRRRSLVDNGIEILTGKREALRLLLEEAVRREEESRRRLDELMREAEREMMVARAMEPGGWLSSAAQAAGRELTVSMSVKNVWGAKTPEGAFPDTRRSLTQRGSAPGFRSPAVDETAAAFERVMRALLEHGVAERTRRVVEGALSATNRRVNALEQRVAPGIEDDIETIKKRLEEKAREETFRMKRFKRIRDRR
jgi:V/A-type H+-transporting ATPase subunit D